MGSINPASSQPDLLILGADADDPFGRARMAVVDWDLDGVRDLLIEGPPPNLPTDAFSDVGEMRSVEWVRVGF